jgi:hypothetical protein
MLVQPFAIRSPPSAYPFPPRHQTGHRQPLALSAPLRPPHPASQPRPLDDYLRHISAHDDPRNLPDAKFLSYLLS